MIPFIGGAAFTYYVYRKLRVSSASIFFLIVNWTGFSWFYYLLFSAIAVLLFPESFSHIVPKHTLFWFTGIFALLFLVGFFLFRKRGKNFVRFVKFLYRAINSAAKGVIKKEVVLSEKFELFVAEFYDSFALLFIAKRKIPLLLAVSFLIYAGNIATLYVSFLVFGIHPDLAIVVFGYAISFILATFTFIPEVPGVTEASFAAVFIALGVPSHIAVFAPFLFRIFSYWLPLPLGFFMFWDLRKKNSNAKVDIARKI